MSVERGMVLRNMTDFANFAIDEGRGVASLSKKEYELIFPRVVADLHREGVSLNYSEGDSDNRAYPVSLEFWPASMAARVTHMINAHDTNLFD